MVMGSEMNDGHLAGFAGADLKSAIFNNNLVSGEVFPPSPHLTYLEYNGTPVTDAGLRHVVFFLPVDLVAFLGASLGAAASFAIK